MKWYEEELDRYEIKDVGEDDKAVNEDDDVSGSGQTT